MINEKAITLDIDWACDFMLDDVHELLRKHRVKATWFITHDSPAVQSLKEQPLFELGLHPNFLPGSTQGDSEEEIMENLKAFLPEATSVRTHCLVQSVPILKRFRVNHELLLDSSLYMPACEGLSLHAMEYGDGLRLVRVPYFWGDFSEVQTPDGLQSVDHPRYNVMGLKVFNFHPIHVYLNTANFAQYDKLKNEVRLQTATPEDIELYRNKTEYGVRDFFLSLLAELENKTTSTLTELMLKWSIPS